MMLIRLVMVLVCATEWVLVLLIDVVRFFAVGRVVMKIFAAERTVNLKITLVFQS